MVEVITQNPSWSAEEMEQQVTVPVEATLNGTPHLDQVRSISIFGLSDVKLYFNFDSDYFRDKQEVLNRLQTLALPNGLQPQLSPWSPIGEIYRYQLTGPGYSLNELKATQDWLVRRELKQVPGIIDITTFGGTTRQYQVEADPNKLLAMNVTLPQVLNAIQNSNANAGGNYLTLGDQSINVRALGLLKNTDDIGSVVVAERNGAPVLVRDIGEVKEGFQPRLGKVGRNGEPDVVLGIVLLQKEEKSLPALEGLKKKIHELNHGGLLPPGMHISTIYDRTNLINTTTRTVRHVVFIGLFLVTLVLIVHAGRLAHQLHRRGHHPVCRALRLFHDGAHRAVCQPHLHRRHRLRHSRRRLDRRAGKHLPQALARAPRTKSIASSSSRAQATRPSPCSLPRLIILVAFIPLFTMQGVPGKIFAPMSVTYGFALTGALIFSLIFAPVLAYTGRSRPNDTQEKHETLLGALPPPPL